MSKRGFTLVELLVVILIIALLGGIGIISFNTFFNVGQDRYYRTVESSILLAGNDYFLDHRDELPSGDALSEVSLASLVEGKYIEPVRDSRGNLCTNGTVYAYHENDKYIYEACLRCDDDYHSSGKYCTGASTNLIEVSAITKRTHETRDLTASYNSVVPVLRDNVLATFSLRDIDIEVSKFDVINEKNKVQVPCPMSGNMCTADISESGTYEVIAYNSENQKIASRKINVRIVNLQDGYVNLSARNGSIDYGTTSKTITVTSHHGGTLSVTDDNNTATCSINGTTITCSNTGSLNAGTTINLTVKSAETGSYAEATAYYTLTVNRIAGSFSCADKTYNTKNQTACTCTGGTTSGTLSATNAGTYTAYCTPDANHTIGGSTEKQTKKWTMARISGSFSCADKIYSGDSQTACTCSGGTSGGDLSATNAGTYTAYCTPDANHTINGSTTKQTENWTMARIAGSFSCANKTFNGSSQTACTCSGGTTSGTLSSTNAGTYTAYCTPDVNHTIDDSTEIQTKTWSMAKKTLTITASNQNVKVGSTISTGTDKVTQSGLASGDSITGVTLKASRTDAGKGTITPSALKTSKGASNYTISYKTGTLIMYNVSTKTVKGNNNSGTATFSNISVSTIVSSSVSQNTSPTLSCTKSGTTVTCNISNMTKKTATDDDTCLIATKHLIHSSITGTNIEAFYRDDGSNKYCYYRAGASPNFSGNDWACGSKSSPLNGTGNHCPNNSDYCHASSCWNAVKWEYSSSANKCKCWGRTTNRTYYSEKIILHWY